jgi:4-amino-4-deoxy-L-arabinose transferase-like glycosyltransferase
MNKKIYIAIFLVAFSLRMVFCIPVFMDFERAKGPGSDATNYLMLAEHLLEKQQFSVYEQERGYREAARTPGYPIFIAFANLLSGGRSWFIIVLQCILEGLLACGIFALATFLLSRVLPGLIAAMLYAIHPHQALYTTQVLSEMLFTFVFFFSIAAFVYFIYNKRAIPVLIAGGLLGIATLIRPIAFFFFLPAMLLIIVVYRMQLKRGIIWAAAFIVIFFMVLSPWYIRNYLTFDRIMISAIGNWNIGYYNAAMVIAQKEGISLREAQQQIGEEVQKRYAIPDEEYQYASDNPQICAQIARYGFEVIRRNPGRYAALHAIGFLHVFVPMEYAFLYKLFARGGVEKVSETKAISKEVIGGLFSGRLDLMFRSIMNERFRKFPWWFTLVWFSFSLFQLFIYIFAFKGFIHFWKYERVLFLLFLLTIIYFAILPGPVGDARFRVPAEPLFVLLAGVGIARVKRVKRGTGETGNLRGHEGG